MRHFITVFLGICRSSQSRRYTSHEFIKAIMRKCQKRYKYHLLDFVLNLYFDMYNCFGPGADRAAGGTAILVRQGIIHSHIQLDTPLQATAARITLSKTITLCSIYIPPSSAISLHDIIRKHITAMWQATWDESPLNKLHEIAPIVNEPRTHHLSTRRDQSVFNRCRIGHSRLTHEFLLKGEPPPECIPCNCLLTIKHLLIECVDFNDVRQRFYQVPSLQDLFKTVKPEVILEFLKAAALYRLL